MTNLTDFRKTVDTCVERRLKEESYPQSHNLHSQTPRYAHPLTEHGHLVITACFIPGERKPLHFL